MSAAMSAATIPVVERFERQVEARPDAVAVDDGQARWTYAQLHDRAALVAEHLRAGGLRAGDHVGIALPRTAPALAAILGTLGAGGAYVPFDPAYPADRLALMRSVVPVSWMLGPSAATSRWAPAAQPLDVEALVADGASPTAARPSGRRRLVARAIDSEQAAYVLFTSGSTGQPKGVAVPHRALAALLAWSSTAFAPEELAVTAATTSFSFDPSVFELFATLAAGGTVLLLPNGLSLAELPPGPGATFALGSPSTFSELLRSGRFPATVRTVMIGGERLPAALARRLLTSGPGRRLVFAYGPTEAAMTTLAYDVPVTVQDPVPIGTPLPLVGAHLVDGHGQLVADGEAGELCLSGPQLALGYVGQPARTAERFVPMPASAAAAGERMYRTGDRARRRPDGSYEFLGRLDDQMKVRGYRVEPGDVEAALCRHPEVAQALVVGRSVAGAATLVAYVVPLGASVDVASLGTFARQTLPPFMVPSSFVVVPAFPLNPSGKVDLDQLATAPLRPAPAPPAPAPRRAATEARCSDELERRVARIAVTVTEVDQRDLVVGPTTNLFDDLGATSLVAVRFLAVLEEELGVRLPVTSILGDTTIRGFADLVRHRTPLVNDQLQVCPDGDELPLVLVHAYLGPVLRYRRLAPFLPAGQPLFGIHVHPEGEPARSVEAMAEHAIAQLRSLRPAGPYVVGGHSAGGLVAFEMARRLTAAGEEVPLVILIDSPVSVHGWRYWWQEIKLNWPDFRDRTNAERVARVRTFVSDRLVGLGRRAGAGPAAGPSAGAGVAPPAAELRRASRASYLAVQRYEAQPYAGDVLVLRTVEGTTIAGGDEALGWRPYVGGRLSTTLVGGGHDEMFSGEHLPRLALALNTAVAGLARSAPVPQAGTSLRLVPAGAR